MGLTDSDISRLRNANKIENQLVLTDILTIKDFPAEPYKSAYFTNNFAQNTLSRAFGYNSAIARWQSILASSEGTLAAGLYFYNGSAFVNQQAGMNIGIPVWLSDRDGENTAVIDSEPLPVSGLLTHAGLEIAQYGKVSVQVSSTVNATARVQVSDDNTNFYDIKTGADADISFNVNNEKICFEVSHTARYMRVSVQNSTTTEGNVTVVVNGQV